jgi:hypothetical protein
MGSSAGVPGQGGTSSERGFGWSGWFGGSGLDVTTDNRPRLRRLFTAQPPVGLLPGRSINCRAARLFSALKCGGTEPRRGRRPALPLSSNRTGEGSTKLVPGKGRGHST